jgi:Uma2 family endonuclease
MATVTPMSVDDAPARDGRPDAGAWLHVRAVMLLHQALEDFFEDRPDVFVASDLTWYLDDADPPAAVTPDVMVIPTLGPRDPRQRRSFRSREEGGAVPAAVFEVVSQDSWREDLEEKFERYERLGVREYFLYDPEGASLVPRLQGHRLAAGAYRRLKQSELESELGFGLRVEDTMLRLVNTRTGRPVYTRAEAVAVERDRADNALLRAAAEQQRADALQAEVDRLRALLDRYGHREGTGR